MPPLVKTPRDRRSSKRRLQDLAQTSKRTIDPDDRSKKGRAALAAWRRAPNTMDVIGVDDHATGMAMLDGKPQVIVKKAPGKTKTVVKEVVKEVKVPGPTREVIKRVEVPGPVREVVKEVKVPGPTREVIKEVVKEVKVAAAGQGVKLTKAEKRRLDRIAGRREKEGKGYGDPTFAFSIRDPREKYWFQWRVRDIDDFIPSHTTQFNVNPAYTKELQPRDRQREAAKMNVRQQASQLADEILLYDSGALDVGPPIVGPDMMVESGNGRFIMLQIAEQYYPQRYAEYQRRLREEADAYGLDAKDFEGVENPVLVRERITPLEDRVAFVTEANNQPTQAMATIEQATSDAARVDFGAIAALQPAGDSADIDAALLSPRNRHPVESILQIIPKEERAALLGKDGRTLNSRGLERIKAALFFAVYSGAAGERLGAAVYDAKDASARNLQEGLQNSLPAMAALVAQTREGAKDPALDIGPDLAVAVDAVMEAKRRDESIDVVQRNRRTALTPDPDRAPLTDTQLALAKAAEAYIRTPAKWRDFLNGYARWGLELPPKPPPEQAGMMMGAPPPERDWGAERAAALQRAFDATKGARAGDVSLAAASAVEPAAAPKPPATVSDPMMGGAPPKREPAPPAMKATDAAEPRERRKTMLNPQSQPTSAQTDLLNKLASEQGFGSGAARGRGEAWIAAVADVKGMSGNKARKATRGEVSEVIDELVARQKAAKDALPADQKLRNPNAPISGAQRNLLNKLAREFGLGSKSAQRSGSAWVDAIAEHHGLSNNKARKATRGQASEAIDAMLAKSNERKAAIMEAESAAPEKAVEPPKPAAPEKPSAAEIDAEIKQRYTGWFAPQDPPASKTEKEVNRIRNQDLQDEMRDWRHFIETSASIEAYRRARTDGFDPEMSELIASSMPSGWEPYSKLSADAKESSGRTTYHAREAAGDRAVLKALYGGDYKGKPLYNVENYKHLAGQARERIESGEWTPGVSTRRRGGGSSVNVQVI